MLFRVSFDARYLEGKRQVGVSRPWGGGGGPPVSIGPEWARRTVDVECDPRFKVFSFVVTPVQGFAAAAGTFEIDNVHVQRLGPEGQPIGEDLAVNGGLDNDTEGWSAHALEWD
jgi:hypothetical protein